MSRQRAIFTLVSITLAIILAVVGLTWVNYRLSSVSSPDDHFAAYWISARAFLIDGISPYSDGVTEQIQVQVYGYPVGENQFSLRAMYPLYTGLLFLPFAVISDYAWSRAVWLTGLEIALGALIVLCMRLATGGSQPRWRPAWWLLLVYILFAGLGYASLFPLLNGSTATLAALCAVLSLTAIKSEHDEVAGVFLALASIQLVMMLVWIVFVLLWAVGARRWRIWLWFLGVLAFLIVLGMFIIPDWPVQFLRTILHNTEYPPPGNPASVLFGWLPGVGRQMGWGVTILCWVVVFVEWVRSYLQARDARHDFRWLLWTASLTLAISPLLGLPTAPGSFALFLLPMTLIVATLDERGDSAGRFIAVLGMLLLGAGLWALALFGSGTGPGLLFALPPITVLGLYWVRRWFVRPRLFIEELRAHLESER